MSAQTPPPPVDPVASSGTTKTTDDRNRQIAIAIVAGIAILFAALNSQEVKVNWIITSWKTPLILVIGLAVGAGYLTAWLIARHNKKKSG
jgi:uncharacterized integral membrane protein